MRDLRLLLSNVTEETDTLFYRITSTQLLGSNLVTETLFGGHLRQIR